MHDPFRSLGRMGKRHRRVPPRALANGRGFSLVDVLLASSLALVLLLAVYSIFDSSRTTYAAGVARIEVQQSGRMAMDILEADLRLAGYGFPTDTAVVSPQLKITAATASAINFWADLTHASTTLASDANPGDTAVTVTSAAGLKAGDTIYLINGAQWQALSVSSVGSTTVSVPEPGATAFYPRGSQVGRPKPITYSWNEGTLSKDNGEGGGAQPLADGIQALQFRYFDGADVEISPLSLAANLANIRRIAISLTAHAPPGTASPQALTVTSAVRPRNL